MSSDRQTNQGSVRPADTVRNIPAYVIALIIIIIGDPMPLL